MPRGKMRIYTWIATLGLILAIAGGATYFTLNETAGLITLGIGGMILGVVSLLQRKQEEKVEKEEENA